MRRSLCHLRIYAFRFFLITAQPQHSAKLKFRKILRSNFLALFFRGLLEHALAQRVATEHGLAGNSGL